MTTTQADKLTALRRELKNQGVNGFLVPHDDEFLNEYLPASAERLAWLTGFTGSAGEAVVLEDKALAITDTRYEIQISQQVDETLFDRRVISAALNKEVSLPKWLEQNAQPGSVIGYDPKLHKAAQIDSLTRALSAKNITFRALPNNPLDAIWQNRPAAPKSLVDAFPDTIAGRTAREKREEIAKSIADEGATAAIISQPDSIAWLLNVRGTDVPHTPLALSYAIVHSNGDVDWFIEQNRIPAYLKAHLGNHVVLHNPETLTDAMAALAQKSKMEQRPVLVDDNRSPIWFRQALEAQGGLVKNHENPCVLPKACKTPPEQAAIRNAHLRDAISLVKFLAWFEGEAPKGKLDEIGVGIKLEEFRRVDAGFRDTSFDTIAGWNANGAIVHYRATAEKNKQIVPPGMLLLDSGAQYQEGTTDITRTLAVGKVEQEMKDKFTLVLKGHIGIASLKFPEGIRGADIDVLARQALWKGGLNYGHGTGHGVGIYLSVHEEGGAISSRAARPFRAGMVVSNEPGYYKKDAFGIRIESLVLVVEDGMMEDGATKRLSFDTLTLVPIDRRLVNAKLLNDEERIWLNDYHSRVYAAVSPHLTGKELKWLKEATKPIKKPEATGPVSRWRNSPQLAA